MQESEKQHTAPEPVLSTEEQRVLDLARELSEAVQALYGFPLTCDFATLQMGLNAAIAAAAMAMLARTYPLSSTWSVEMEQG